jgi:hypothetical protein
MGEIIQFNPELKCVRLVQNMPGASGGEIIWFVSRSERERARLIREARAIYDRIFPPADPLSAQQDKVQGGYLATGAASVSSRGEGILS